MAEYQYISGEFRGRFEFEQPLAAGDIQLPRTAAVLRTAAPLEDIRAFGTVIEEAIMDKDRFKITPIEGMPDGSMGFSYYAWRNSPYLTDRFFSEWKLGIFLAVQQGEFVFMHDTEGLVVDMDGLSLKRASRSVMEKAFPEDDVNPSGLTAAQLNDLLRASCRNPSFDREIWIVGAKIARREALAGGLDQEPWANRLRQFLMHWDAMQTACARANTRLRFYCST